MAKWCDCKTLYRRVVYTCGTSPLSLFAVNKEHTWACYEPRETPLLVDALAIAGKLLLEKMDNIGDGMLFNLDLLDARDILRQAMARHQEEGDA